MKVFGIKNRLGKFCVQRCSMRPFAVSRVLYEGNVVVTANTVVYGTAAAHEIFLSSKQKVADPGNRPV